MGDRIQIRRDTASNWSSADPVLANGELGIETDTGRAKRGDGGSAWSALGYLVHAMDQDVTTGDSVDFAGISQGGTSVLLDSDLAANGGGVSDIGATRDSNNIVMGN